MALDKPQFPDGKILDYASPMMRRPLRLAEKSILTFLTDQDGMQIVETLEGKAKARYAIFFAAGAMAILGLTINGSYKMFSALWMEAMGVYAAFVVGVVTLIIALISSNWQQTILTIGAEHLHLFFTTPFKNRLYKWTWDQVCQARVVQELDPPTQRIKCELQIDLWSHPLVRLFSGHDLRELGLVAEELHRHQPGTSSSG